jgi:hypothetical protein
MIAVRHKQPEQTTVTFKTLADLDAAYHGRQLYSDGAGRVAVWQPTLSVYVWYSYDHRRNCWQQCGSTEQLTDDAAPIGFELAGLVRQLFTHVDAKGHPQTRVGGTTEYSVLVPIPTSLLRQLRAAIAQN